MPAPIFTALFLAAAPEFTAASVVPANGSLPASLAPGMLVTI